MLCHLINREPFFYLDPGTSLGRLPRLFYYVTLKRAVSSLISYLRMENLEAVVERKRQNCFAMCTFSILLICAVN
jgi:hypothetical protein